MSRITVFALSSTGKAWLSGPSRPMPAATAVSPSKTGTRAATSEPNARKSTSSVTGMASNSTRSRSSSMIASCAREAAMSPVSSTLTCGCARVAVTAAWMRSNGT